MAVTAPDKQTDVAGARRCSAPPPGGDGHAQRHAGFLFRRRPFLRSRVAIAHARRMVAEGADIIDIGAEFDAALWRHAAGHAGEELRGCEPVLPRCGARRAGLDRHHEGERRGLGDRAGAAIVNDVWGLQRDPDMARVVAEHGVPVIVHAQPRRAPTPRSTSWPTSSAFFARSLEIADAAGIARDRIVLDPGIGFGKTPEQSITRYRPARGAATFGLPILIGAVAQALHRLGRTPRNRTSGSAARSPAHLLAARAGAAIVRVARRARNRAGAPGRGGDRDRPTMSDTIFVPGLVVHAYHGVMEHEAEVGQQFMLDLDARHRPRGRRAPTGSPTRLLRRRRRSREPRRSARKRYRLVEAAGGAVADALLAAFPRVPRDGHRAQAARADRRHRSTMSASS